MKLSEFDRRSFQMWEGSSYAHSVSYKDFARLRRDGAEAAGVVWDPEEPELPEKIYLSDAGFARATAPGVEYRLWEVKQGDVPGYLRVDRQAIAAEAVRRYNAWPELEKLLSDMERGDWTVGKPIERLRGILIPSV